MRGAYLLLLLLLAGCLNNGGYPASGTSFEARHWRLPTGKPPSEAELAALVAACQDRERGAVAKAQLAPCLVNDFGMRRVP